MVSPLQRGDTFPPELRGPAVGFAERENGSLEVKVHQNVKDLQGNLMFDGMVKHIYTFQDSLIKTMDIELVENN